MEFNELVYWNNNSYGKAKRIDKKFVRGLFIVLCVITPFTNWLIPFIKTIIRNDIIIRW